MTGNVDVGYRNIDVSNNATKNVSYITQNNASTSALFFQATEDLGGGMKAMFMGEADFAPVKVSLANGGSTNNGQWYTGGFFNAETYVGMSGNMGNIKLGAPNSPMLDVNANVAQPFGTGLGGGYSDTFGRFGTTAAVGINGYAGNATTARVIRNERAMVLTTPTMSGFTGQLEYAMKNGNGEAVTSTASTNGTSFASNTNGFQGLNLKYADGPLTVAANSSKLTAGAIAAGGAWSAITSSTGTATAVSNKANTQNAIAAGTSVKYTSLAANYAVNNALTVYAGMTAVKTSNQDTPSATNTVEDSKSTNLAAKYTVGQYDFLANTVSRKSNIAADVAVYAPKKDAKLVGLGVNYNFSKNSSTYVRYEKATDVATNGSGAAANAFGNQTITSVGLRMKF